MIQLILVVAAVIGVSVLWWGRLPGLPNESVSTTTATELVDQVKVQMMTIASTTALQQREALGEVALTQGSEAAGSVDDFGPLYPMHIGTVSVRASVAKTPTERAQGLSDTTVLPTGVVKLFVFSSDASQRIWMKDMRYAIDILWANAAGEVVHIEQAVDPSTYPAHFESPTPARYVVETEAGFVARHGVGVGTKLVLPKLQ